MRQLDRGEIKLFFHTAAYMPLLLIVSEIYGRKSRNGEKFEFFFELFCPPCRNALADLDGSIPECVQVCALHIGLHLASLRKIEMVAVLCRGRWEPQGEGARWQTLSLHK